MRGKNSGVRGLAIVLSLPVWIGYRVRAVPVPPRPIASPSPVALVPRLGTYGLDHAVELGRVGRNVERLFAGRPFASVRPSRDVVALPVGQARRVPLSHPLPPPRSSRPAPQGWGRVSPERRRSGRPPCAPSQPPRRPPSTRTRCTA